MKHTVEPLSLYTLQIDVWNALIDSELCHKKKKKNKPFIILHSRF